MKKLLDMFIDSFWIVGCIFFILYAIEYFGIHLPIETRDTLYLIGDIMDNWLPINCIVGGMRFIQKIFDES